MKNIIDNIYFNPFTAEEGYDDNKIAIESMKAVLPLVLKNQLTDKQRLCFTMFYNGKKSQKEIAKILGLSQPTVSHHIVTAKNVSSEYLKYCLVAVTKANDCWRAYESI